MMAGKQGEAPCHFGLQSGSGGGGSLTPADEQSLLVSFWNCRRQAGPSCFKKEDFGRSMALSFDTPPTAPIALG